MKKSFLSRLLYEGKHNRNENSDHLSALLLPSILGILLCAICLMGSTWAWFTATQSTTSADIKAANYTVSVTVNDAPLDTNGPVTLEIGTYTVTLTADGDAGTGYCKVKIGNAEKLTQQFPSANYPEKSITFTLIVNEATTVEWIPWWGTSIVDDAERIRNDSTHTHGTASATEETTTPEAETKELLHTVVEGDTLYDIALKYNTTVDALQVYNGIENARYIKPGDIIHIPITE